MHQHSPETLQYDTIYHEPLLFSWSIAETLIAKRTARGFKGKFVIPLPEPRIAAGVFFKTPTDKLVSRPTSALLSYGKVTSHS
ncbi:MAG: hypothetical protein WC765_08185 [Phycisphaerae bacterium]|jgi:hypothetical protein